MGDKPILFSSPMVRVLLAGTKTQTRRILKPQPARVPGRITGPWQDESGQWGMLATDWAWSESLGNYEPASEKFIPFRIRAVGDRLWVREHWKTFVSLDAVAPRDLWVAGGPRGAGLLYLADNGSLSMTAAGVPTFGSREGNVAPFGKHRQAIHMPRWASRLTLTVTDVRVQRLQDISEADAIAEGVTSVDGNFWVDGLKPATYTNFSAREAYRYLWNLINGSGAWDGNPWVTCYSFTVEHRNIDAVQSTDEVAA